jgi:hypothetical protein
MFFIAALTSGSAFSWLDPAGFFCGLANPEGAFARKNDAAITEIVPAGMIFFTNGLFVRWMFFFHVI